MYTRCKIWNAYDPQNCHQKLIDYNACWEAIILGVFWPWLDYLYALYRRSGFLRRQHSLRRPLGHPTAFSDIVSDGAARYKRSRWLPSFRTVYFVTLASEFVVNLYDIMDLKISNRLIISRRPVMQESDESEWGFGQIVPMVMLLSIPIAIARISKRFICPSRFGSDLLTCLSR
ncbi:hypothetical protein K440DRAFT_612078 [Wilcoxina mikolae CBS 423.85]|nr:hypothetical protein K440DRAFT_612078 [Wilcoxina mikolae CBS 423.85]